MKSVPELLIEAARRNPPSDRVPDGFEQRFMAQLRKHQNRSSSWDLRQNAPADAWSTWTRTFLRAAWSGSLVAGFLAICLLMMPLQGLDDASDLGMTDVGSGAVEDGGGDIW